MIGCVSSHYLQKKLHVLLYQVLGGGGGDVTRLPRINVMEIGGFVYPYSSYTFDTKRWSGNASYVCYIVFFSCVGVGVTLLMSSITLA